jgi:uncharacterized membrane protein required for colicin V production
MASSILFIVVLFFSIRGFFLAFPGVIARLLGFISGYIIAYSYRSQLAALIADKTSIELPLMVLQIISSAILFFSSLFLVGLATTSLFRLLAKILPFAKGLLKGDSTGSRVFGAACNGLIGASIVLLVLWGYAIFTDHKDPEDTLQQVANTFGNSLLALAITITGEKDNFSFKKTSYSFTSRSVNRAQKPTGSAVIVSEDNQHRRMALTTENPIIEMLNQSGDNTVNIQQLLKNKDVQDMLNNPAIQEQLIKQLNENPELMMDALNNPKFRELMEQFN